MRKLVIAVVTLMVFGWMCVGFASSAAAYGKHRPGCNCGPVTPTIHNRMIHPAQSQTRYFDKSVTRYVHRVHRVVNVTRVQPIIHIHEVMRIHHHTVVETRDAYESHMVRLMPIRVVSRSVQNFYDCRCGL